jgi:hypothetical protein
MNKLRILSLIFFSLLGMADISLAMDKELSLSLATTTNKFTKEDILKFFPTQNKETILKLPNVRIWIKTDKEQKYYSLDDSGDFSKYIKDGHCQLWCDEDRYFVQPVDSIQNIFTQKAIQIRPLAATEFHAVTTSGNSVVIGLENKSYILKNTNPGYVPNIIPFHTINVIPTFFKETNNKLFQIQEGENTNDALYHRENLSEDFDETVGTVHGLLGNKLLIDIHNEQLTRTIGLLIQPDLFKKICSSLETNNFTFAHYKTMEEGIEKSVLILIRNKDKSKDSTAENNSELQAIIAASPKEDKELLNNRKQIRQISNDIYELTSLPKEKNNTVYGAVKVKRIDITKYKIIFYIAGQKYIRVAKGGLEAYKTYYIAINDIIDGAYVSFKLPSDLSLPLNIWEYAFKKTKPKSDHNSIKNPLEKEIIELLDIESIGAITNRYAIKSFPSKDPWLRTICGYIEKETTNSFTRTLILQDNNNRISIELDNHIADEIVKHITGNRSKKHIVLQNKQGIDTLIIKCSFEKPPLLEGDQQELRNKAQTLPTPKPKQPDLEKPQDKKPAPTYFNSLLKKLIQYRYPIGGVVSISITASLLYYLHAIYNS